MKHLGLKPDFSEAEYLSGRFLSLPAGRRALKDASFKGRESIKLNIYNYKYFAFYQ
jgi:hypothetical protein